MKYSLITVIICLMVCNLYPAWLTNIPNQLTQPDGTVIDVYYSGDEHHNWVHDKDNYTMIQDDKTGYVCWAIANKGSLTSTGYPVHLYTPKTLDLQPGENISKERYQQKRHRINDYLENSLTRAPSTGIINLIVIFIRFSDDDEYTGQTSYYNNLYNASGEDVNSLRQYYWDASYQQLTVNSPFFPIPYASTVASYQDIHPRSYYQPYNEVTNPNGYTDGEDSDATQREHQLLARAVAYIADEVPANLNIDSDNNNQVDNVHFVLKGDSGAWASLLWPHAWALFSETAVINGKRVWDYNLLTEIHMQHSGVSVLAHEFGHTIGAPDYYRYHTSGDPVTIWDIMGVDSNPPPSMSAYTKWHYMHWVDSMPTIEHDDYYTLYPITISQDQHALQILSPFSDTEYFVVEYRNNLTGLTDSTLPGSGLVVWRVNSLVEWGNGDGPPDELYVYRLDGTPDSDGNLDLAYFSSESGRTAINDTTNPYSFLSDGLPGGLDISDIGSAGETITFFVNVGQPFKPPINLTAELLENNVVLNWVAPINATPTGYNVYRDQELTPLNANIIANTTYVDGTITIDGLYTYTVRAVYPDGISNDSNPAQAAIITPSMGFTSTFEDGTSDGWVIVNGTQANKWIVGTVTASESNYSIYISNNNNTTTYSNIPSTVHFFRDIIYSSAVDNTLSFDLKGTGEPDWDMVRVYLCDISYIPLAGSTPTGELLDYYWYYFWWSTETINLPDQPLDTKKRIVFTWINDDSQAGPPSAAIDNIVFTSGTSSTSDEVPLLFKTALDGNYPNPFNPSTVIRFSLAGEFRVSVDIYNLKGQLVRSVVDGVYKAGKHNVVWNGEDERGGQVSSGIYLYRMRAGGYTEVRKMLLLK